jgi:Domain of unknown function (DUF4271)
LKKNIQNIVYLLILFISSSTFATAQEGSPQPSETPKPTTTPKQQPTTTPNTSGTTVTNPKQTTETIVVPTQPVPQRRRRKPTLQDSMRLAAIRVDSLAQEKQSTTKNNSAFNIDPTSTPTTSLATSIDSTTQPMVDLSNTDVPMLTTSDNPFEILRGDVASIDTSTNKTKTILEQSTPSLLNREVYSKNFLFWIFLISLSLMALVVANARSTVRNTYQSLLSNNALRQIYRLQAGWGNVAQLALYGLFLLNASIFAFLMVYRFVGQPPTNQFWTFLYCILGISGAFLTKHTILYIISSVFPIAKEVKLYNFIIITSGIFLGLILLPLNLFIAYSPEILGNILTYTALGAIGIVYLVRSLRSLSIASPFLATDQFHFLIYLCAVEIAPLFVLAKLLISKSPI